MADVFTLGESMLRLATSDARRLEEADSLSVAVGGAESNVASNLARLGKKVEWFSRLPDSPLGAQVINTLRRHGVETPHVQRVVGERLGTYFLEYGAAPRGIRVIYDRAESAASHMTPADLPLDAIAASRWLHLTGITPALSASCAETVSSAIAHAQAHQVRIAFDVNYRALLWSPEDAAKQLAPLCAAADVVFVALRDAVSLFHAPDTMDAALHELQARWGGIIIMTEGEQGASAYDGQAIYSSPAFPVTIVDRIGAGDAFVSGVLCRLLEDAPLDDALRFGAAMSALKLTIAGDIAVVSRAEVETLIGGQGSQLKR